MVASGSRAAMSPMPKATAGAVSLFAGSAKMFPGGSMWATRRTSSS